MNRRDQDRGPAPPASSGAAKDAERSAPKDNDMVAHTVARHPLSAEERHARICETAYRHAEKRGFAPGMELEDWLNAEREVDGT